MGGGTTWQGWLVTEHMEPEFAHPAWVRYTSSPIASAQGI